MTLQGNHQQSLELSIHSSWQISPAWPSGLFMTLLVITWCLTQLACYFWEVYWNPNDRNSFVPFDSHLWQRWEIRQQGNSSGKGRWGKLSICLFSTFGCICKKNILSGNNWCNSINSTKWTFNFFVAHKIASFLERSHYTDTTHKAVAWSKFPAITLKSFLSVISRIQSLGNSVVLTSGMPTLSIISTAITIVWASLPLTKITVITIE